MPEVIDLFHQAAQSFSEAKQIADTAVAEGRGMTPEEELRHNQHFNEGADLRAAMQQQRAEEASARIATIEGEMAQFINDGGGAGLSEEARRRTRAYHEQFNARSVPYRWHQHGPADSALVRARERHPQPGHQGGVGRDSRAAQLRRLSDVDGDLPGHQAGAAAGGADGPG